MMDALRTAGDLRTFLADVLVDIRAKRVTPDEAGAIAKVAGEINKSLAVEVQTALASGVRAPVPGSMAIGSPEAPALLPEGAGSEDPDDEPTEPPKNKTENITQPEPAPPSQPKPKITEICQPPLRDGDKIWCEQCEQRVTVGQAIGCKSRFCTAKAAA